MSGHDILRHCSHATFKDKLWPATQKALLRNPEIILQGILYIIAILTCLPFTAAGLNPARDLDSFM